ncbi:hypothetical protein [Agriterribacter humi]|uniref:hypothetical protein n=1 Tax=Agriterribacter humi TaxID=1104781 RepID=UPI001264760C|nr:hypothetical protein [Agriterribacter humi]
MPGGLQYIQRDVSFRLRSRDILTKWCPGNTIYRIAGGDNKWVASLPDGRQAGSPPIAKL